VLAVAVAFGSTTFFEYLIRISIAIACLLILVVGELPADRFRIPFGRRGLHRRGGEPRADGGAPAVQGKHHCYEYSLLPSIVTGG
jgi:hypothetical protein